MFGPFLNCCAFVLNSVFTHLPVNAQLPDKERGGFGRVLLAAGLPGTQPELRGLLEKISEEKPGEVGAAASINTQGAVNKTILYIRSVNVKTYFLREVQIVWV